MLPNLKSTQFSSSKLLSLLSSKLRQKSLLFLHKDILFFAFNFWYIDDLLIHPFAVIIVKLSIPPKCGHFLVILSGALQSLPLSHYLNNLIALSKILEETCHGHLAALTRSVTVNKSKICPTTVISNFQNNVMFMDNSEQRKMTKNLQ